MERVKQKDREGRRCLLLMETVGKVLMSDTPAASCTESLVVGFLAIWRQSS